MLPLNEMLKIESVGDLVLREHVDLLLQKMTADDDDDYYVVHFGQCSDTVVFPKLISGQRRKTCIYPSQVSDGSRLKSLFFWRLLRTLL